MPCDAIAVAKGKVPLDPARELGGLGTEAVTQALLALLRQRCARLGQPELTPLWRAHSGAHSRARHRRADRQQPDPRLARLASHHQHPHRRERQAAEQVHDAVTGLLTSLGGWRSRSGWRRLPAKPAAVWSARRTRPGRRVPV